MRKEAQAPFEFNGSPAVAMLVTMTSNGRCLSIVILTNTEDYQAAIEKFLESVDLKKIEAPSQPVSSTNNTSIIGTWTMSSSSQSNYRVNNGIMNYIIRQYTLNENGTYTFITKTFDPLMDKLLLGKENGTYQISGNNLTLTPQKSVLEAWSKKDGTDKWGNFLSTQNITLEKVTYQFTKHYFSGIQEWNLVLQAGSVTKRDGPFSGNTTFSNAYYYSPLSNTHPVIELPGNKPATQETKSSVSSPAIKSSFAFTSSNFDDGWTSTEQEDWVQVSKGGLTVLLHYPTTRIDVSSADYKTISNNAWNTLVAPRYSNLSDFFLFGGSLDYERPHFIAGNVTDKSGKKVYVALFKKGNSGWIEFITPDKNSFVQTFGLDINQADYYMDSEKWKPLSNMAGYNKFAVSPADLKGKWVSNFAGMIQYVNVYTGADAGANSHSSTESFAFTGNSYHWELSSASGMVGNLKFQGAKSDGTVTVPNNWQIHFSNMEGKPKTFNAYFSCTKGARLLWLEDTGYAIGYTAYGKKE